jgi:enoyl-CoA hydratase/carnithine racemase
VREGRIAVLTYTSPPRNFMTFAALEELGRLVRSLGEDDELSLLMITGGLERDFIAHAELRDLVASGRGEPTDGDYRGSWVRAVRELELVPQPVVAAINGQCWGGGLEIIAACSLRIAAASAHFAQAEVDIGVIPGGGGSQRLPRIVGRGRGVELVLSGRRFDAEEALAVGLVSAVLPDTDFRQHALEWCAPIARKSREALVAAKRVMREGFELPLPEALELEREAFEEIHATAGALRRQEKLIGIYREQNPGYAANRD